MKIIIRVAILLLVALAIFYFTGNRVKENEPLQSPVKHGTAMPVTDKGVGAPIPQTSRPEKGLSVFVGDKAETLVEEWGEPTRVEPSGYGYDWWVYLNGLKFMAGVNDKGIVNQIYTTELEADINPFQIGQNIDDIFRFTIVGSEVDVMIDENIYTFSLNSEDLKTRLLIIYKDLFVQLYLDNESGDLIAVRFINPETLVLHQPYEMTYMGELIVSKPPSSTLQLEVNRTAERQIFEITNLYRQKFNVPALINDYDLNIFARKHSEKMALENYSTEESTDSEKLSDRLDEAMIEHRKAAENIAFDYVDAIGVVHGWLNSTAHRSILLDKDFTHMGTGSYGNYYTQDFIKASKEDVRRK
ncbi:hypothetical protein JSQ81_18635 [Sporosarcina sp. Marseille-Q4063]|uniref:CAP domain-containing protein n=1 Tax=Sporosarcina sp. Marseille-Q4063 TaxID=2810514 RepID=UPI001BAED79E|nr:CAP-associated domain-containing protein [Sporosarcina sp. Marseille-Q4063]QUW21771.1 hypothetical protein JSQ81_18635 [Sporosarcina sp. Marseille-Q4063]